MPFYQRIKDLREDADKNQSEIARYLETTTQYYGKYEKGDRELPFSRAIKLAEYYNVSLDYLAGRTQNKKVDSNFHIYEDEVNLVNRFRALSERNKGKVELFVEQLYRFDSSSRESSTTQMLMHGQKNSLKK